MTKEEYINTLTPDEMRSVIRQCWEWSNENGCPMSEGGDDSFDCKRDFPQGWCEECDEDIREQYGCWVMFYVWKYRRKIESWEKLKTMGKEAQDEPRQA